VATETKQDGRVVVQSVLSPDLAARLKAQAEAERRTISATVRNAIEDQLQKGNQ
jgi:predicted transcriptional regulator